MCGGRPVSVAGDGRLRRKPRMAKITPGKMNVSEFLAWCELPENDRKSFELDCGEVIEMSRPGPKHGLSAWLVGLILG